MRPLGDWPNKTRQGKPAQFTASWQNTLDLLGRETELLGAKLVVIQVDVREGDIRQDGMLYGRAKVDYRGVRISFESKHGPLTYATDMYEKRWRGGFAAWQENVRAIALGLEALRSVDRYGITKSGEQYRGWAAIEAQSAIGFASMEDAEAFIAEHAGAPAMANGLRESPEQLRRQYRAAARNLHPDRGGDASQFARLNAAYRMLGGKR